MSNWKNETCEKCEFRINNFCRKNPPTTTNDKTMYVQVGFPRGLNVIEFMYACAEFKPKEDNNAK